VRDPTGSLQSRSGTVELEPGDATPAGERQSSVVDSTLSPASAAARIVDALVARGVETYFGIPGGPICPLIEALRLHPRARFVATRQETHAAFAAATYQRATGRVAGVVVTAGPGVTNVITGVASAYLERIPLLVLAGDVAWATHGGRLAQDSGPEGIDSERLLAAVTRATVRVTNGRSAVSQVLTALDAATNPLAPGPALLVVPIDRATEVAPNCPITASVPPLARVPDLEPLKNTARLLAGAERPLLVLGGGCLEHAASVRRLVDALDVPFVTTPRAKGVVSEEHPRSLRNGGMAASLWARRYTATPVDVALVLGSDLDDTSVGATPYIGAGGQLIHVDVDARVFNRNLPTALGITCDLAVFARELEQVVSELAAKNSRGSTLMQAVHAESAYDVPEFRTDAGLLVPPHRAIADLAAAVGPGARFITDIGEHMLFALHYLTARAPLDFNIQLNLGSMGSGIAGALGLALADPSRQVVCIAGDGGMQMSGMEIVTCLKLRLPVLYAVFNDARYNMVHHGMGQIFGQTGDHATPPVDFAAWAASIGVPARSIRAAGEIDRALVRELMRDGGPALLDIYIDPELRLRAGGRVEALQHMSMLSHAAEPGSAR
jgi:acetolactate synthase-1/2/3 large subunit